MYDQFIGKLVKLVYKDGKKGNKDYVRYVRGKVTSSDKKSLGIKIDKTQQLFAVALSQIVYVKEIKSLK